MYADFLLPEDSFLLSLRTRLCCQRGRAFVVNENASLLSVKTL